jgi:hypothetical protein
MSLRSAQSSDSITVPGAAKTPEMVRSVSSSRRIAPGRRSSGHAESFPGEPAGHDFAGAVESAVDHQTSRCTSSAGGRTPRR